MAIKSQQLRQSFLISGAGAAVLLVVFVAWLTSNRVGQVLEQEADAAVAMTPPASPPSSRSI